MVQAVDGVGMPLDTTGGPGKCCCGEKHLEYCLGYCHHSPIPDKRKKMNGWTYGWVILSMIATEQNRQPFVMPSLSEINVVSLPGHPEADTQGAFWRQGNTHRC